MTTKKARAANWRGTGVTRVDFCDIRDLCVRMILSITCYRNTTETAYNITFMLKLTTAASNTVTVIFTQTKRLVRPNSNLLRLRQTE